MAGYGTRPLPEGEPPKKKWTPAKERVTYANKISGYGGPVPVVYGRRWVTGTLLMAQRPLYSSYAYFKGSDGVWKSEKCEGSSAVVGLCEGPIAGVIAISRDGTILDQPARMGTSDVLDGVAVAPTLYLGNQTSIGQFYPAGMPAYFGTALYWGGFAQKDGSWPDIQFYVDGQSLSQTLYQLQPNANQSGLEPQDWRGRIARLGKVLNLHVCNTLW